MKHYSVKEISMYSLESHLNEMAEKGWILTAMEKSTIMAHAWVIMERDSKFGVMDENDENL